MEKLTLEDLCNIRVCVAKETIKYETGTKYYNYYKDIVLKINLLIDNYDKLEKQIEDLYKE